MKGEEVTSQDLVNVVSGQILSGPEDSIYDDIFDWIANAIKSITGTITSWVDYAVSTIKSTITSWVDHAIDTITGWIDTVLSWLRAVHSYASQIWSSVAGWVRDAWNTIYGAASSAISRVKTWLSDVTANITNWVTTKVGEINSWLATTASNMVTTILALHQELWAKLKPRLDDLLAKMEPAAASWHTFWATSWPEWWKQRGEDVTNVISEINKVPGWLHEHIADPITDWFSDTFKFLKEAFWGVFDSALEKIKGVASWGMEMFTEGVLSKVTSAFGWVWDKMRAAINWLLEQFTKLVSNIAPISPEGGMGATSGLATIGMVMGGGLAAMTIGGHFVHPLHTIGLGKIAAMVYDMSNYKLILGAFMGAMVTASVRTPLNYYFNYLLRPWILEKRDYMTLISRRAFTDPEALQNTALVKSIDSLAKGDREGYERRFLGYYGLPDQYYGMFTELANSRLGYFPLAGIARTGFFDRVWFTEALHRSGYSTTAVDALMLMYEKMVDEALQGSMSGAAVTRFKEGFTTVEGFYSEMSILGYSDKQIIKYEAAAKMDYATDYTRDLISAYRDAVRKGNISLDDYRGALLDLGLVPERVEGYILRERARLKPGEALTPISPATPTYETDAGKVMIDTTRRKRRKSLISRDQEMAAFIELGMEPGYATALADNDDVRLAEKAGEE